MSVVFEAYETASRCLDYTEIHKFFLAAIGIVLCFVFFYINVFQNMLLRLSNFLLKADRLHKPVGLVCIYRLKTSM